MTGGTDRRSIIAYYPPTPSEFPRDFLHILHGSAPACHKSNDTEISSQFQQNSDRFNMLCHTKTPKRPGNRLKNSFSHAVWACRDCCPPFSDPVFSSSTRHPSPAGITEDCSCWIWLRISRNSAFGTATSAIWNTTHRECLTTLTPILICLSICCRRRYNYSH